MSEPFVLGITGPAGGGKSTVAALLAPHLSRSANVEVDKVKDFIVGGYRYDGSVQGVAQWKLLGDNLGLLAANLRRAGYSVIVNGYLNEPAWQAMASHLALDLEVLLLPSIEVAVQRDLQRDKENQMGEDAIRLHFAYFSGQPFFERFTHIDSTGLSIQETEAQILALIGRNPAED